MLTIEDVLALGVALGLFPYGRNLARSCARLRAYGDGMVPFEKSGLKETRASWKAAREDC
ncbi:hypothetical protein [Yinghuangia sp. YIM S09857]|uniref:hypothetical protein n=1 Tax=Yinghuangia sp. YIM S09857 TaxID=3436929 RepID=UPI003F53B53B